MPNTPYRGYYYPLFTDAAKVPDDLRRALEAVDADVEGLFQDLRIPIEGAIDHGDGTYSFVLSDGTVLEPIAQPVPPSNELTIGTVTTAGVGVPAEATIEGEPPNQVLSLVLPRGSGPNVTWDGTVIIVDGTRGPDLKSTVPGPTGKTAYQYAVEEGFEGTEQEFAEAQLPDSITWDNVDGKPGEYPPETHSHTQEQVDGLTARLTAIEASIAPRAFHGEVSIPVEGGSGRIDMEFPEGTFTEPPVVQVTKQSARAARHIPYVTDQLSTGCRIGLYDPTGTSSTPENISCAVYAYQI